MRLRAVQMSLRDVQSPSGRSKVQVPFGPFNAPMALFQYYLSRLFVHHALRDSTASVDDLRFK
jgi:hypothetical protein